MMPSKQDFSKLLGLMFGLLLISLVIYNGIEQLIRQFSIPESLKFFTSIISTISIMLMLYSLFNKYAWKWEGFQILGIITFPNLNGRWEGELISTKKQKETKENIKLNIAIEIEQTSSNIVINLFSPKSESKSTIAMFYPEERTHPYLHYEYLNTPSRFVKERIKPHKGVANLRFFKRENRIRIDYYNDPKGRKSDGTISLKFISNRLKGKL